MTAATETTDGRGWPPPPRPAGNPCVNALGHGNHSSMGGMRASALAATVVALGLAMPAVLWAHAGADELVAAARAAVVTRPSDPGAQQQLAGALRVAGDWRGALAALDAAEARGGDADEIAGTRAAVLLEAGRPAAALAELDHLLERRPDAPGAHLARGRACLALGRTDEAARELGIAVATLPVPQPEHVLLQRDALLALGRPADAVRAIDAGIARLGPIPALQLPAVDLEVRLGHTDAALRRLDVLFEHGGRNPIWMTRRAEILATAGRRDEARAAYAEAGAILAAHRGSRRIRAFDGLADQIAAALAETSPEGNDLCALQSDAAWLP